MLNPDARAWFGSKYEILTSLGIDGFWNDMNEPAIFYSEEGIRDLNQALCDHVIKFGVEEMVGNPDAVPFEARGILERIQNNPEDYKRFYHNVNGTMVRHDLVHNLYGFNMTRAAGEALKKIAPNKKDAAVLAFFLYWDAPLWRHLDWGQSVVVVAYSAESQDAAIT